MKKFISGLIVGAMLMVSVQAFAAVGDTVQAIFADFKYVVNGEEKTLDAPVLVYEGMSYLRTTQIGNMLGYDITYKADSRTIEFYKPEPITTPTEPKEPIIDPVTGEPSTEGKSNAGGTTGSTEGTTEEPTPSPTPTPTPDNTAACKSISDSWNLKIYSYNGKNPKEQEYTRGLMSQERDAELAAAGCN